MRAPFTSVREDDQGVPPLRGGCLKGGRGLLGGKNGRSRELLPAPDSGRKVLLVDLVGDLLETFQNGVDVFWLCHELLEAFHAGLCHVGWGITVKELGQRIGR